MATMSSLPPPPRAEHTKKREWTVLPAGLLGLYALGAIADSLPLTATTEWLNEDVRMAQATQSMFYAATFLPYSFKPLYGWASEAVGSRRALYVGATSVEAVLYVVTAYAARSAAGAFLVVIARDTCSACAEMMLSATLADIVAWRRQSAAAAQAEAAGARWCGTIAGYLIQLWLYRCSSAGTNTPNAKTVIAATAAVLAPTALFAALGGGSFVAVVAEPGAPKSGDDEASRRRRPRAVAAASLLVLVQGLCVWIALKDVLVQASRRALWRAGLWVFVAAAAGSALVVAAFLLQEGRGRRRRRRPSSAAAGAPLVAVESPLVAVSEHDEEEASSNSSSSPSSSSSSLEPAPPTTGKQTSKSQLAALARGALAPAALVFALNAAPTASVQISNLEYYLFFSAKPCYLPYLELVVAATGLGACVIAARLRGIASLVPLALVVAASAAATLAYAPLAEAEPLGVQSSRVCLGHLCFGRFAYDALARVLTSLTSELAIVAETTLTLRCALALAGGSDAAVYGALLALADAGASVSGWLAAPLVARADITYGDFSRLPWLITVCIYAKLLALVPLPFVNFDDDDDIGGLVKRDDDDGGGDPHPPRRRSSYEPPAEEGSSLRTLLLEEGGDYDDEKEATNDDVISASS